MSESQGSETHSPEELFKRHQAQTWADLQSSSDEYDKAVLALSGGGLGLSLAFIKDVVPLSHAISLAVLLCSWICFAVAMLLVVISYQLSRLAQTLHLEHLQRYYLAGKKEFPSNKFNSWLSWCNAGSGFFLILAVILTIAFAWQNISARNFVADDKKVPLLEGRTVMKVTPLPEIEKGRQVMPVTPLPAATPAPNDSTTAKPDSVPAASNPPKEK